jgi:hypothetical protein
MEMVKHSNNFNCDNKLTLIKTGSSPFFHTLILTTGHVSGDHEETYAEKPTMTRLKCHNCNTALNQMTAYS